MCEQCVEFVVGKMAEQPGMYLDHEQVLTYQPVYVDAGIKQLLENIWARGYYTEWSCQDGYISFRHWGDHQGAQEFCDEIGLTVPVVQEDSDGFYFAPADSDIHILLPYDSNAKSGLYFSADWVERLTTLSAMESAQ